MQRYLHQSLLCSALLLVPGICLAAAYDQTQSAVSTFLNVLQSDKADTLREQSDVSFESGSEIFPLGANAGGDAQTSDNQFITFLENGKTYDLKDVPRQLWFAPFVRDVTARGIVSGFRDVQGVPTGYFHPVGNVTIEQLAKVAVLASGIDPTDCKQSPKNETVVGRWSFVFLGCAEEHQWSIFSDGSVDVARDATRAEVIQTLLEAFKVPILASGTGSVFTDVPPSNLFSDSIFTAVQSGIVSGFADAKGNPTGLFGPEKSINRAEFAKMVSLSLQVFAKD